MQKKKQVKAKGPKPQYTRKEVAGPRIIASQYVASAVRPDQYPEGDTVEVAFLGRSNVGKSSLINSLCNHRGLALVSGTPGKTRTINFFAIESKEDINEDQERRYHWYLVDLPGYGYAKTDRKAKFLWSGFISVSSKAEVSREKPSRTEGEAVSLSSLTSSNWLKSKSSVGVTVMKEPWV